MAPDLETPPCLSNPFPCSQWLYGPAHLSEPCSKCFSPCLFCHGISIWVFALMDGIFTSALLSIGLLLRSSAFKNIPYLPAFSNPSRSTCFSRLHALFYLSLSLFISILLIPLSLLPLCSPQQYLMLFFTFLPSQPIDRLGCNLYPLSPIFPCPSLLLETWGLGEGDSKSTPVAALSNAISKTLNLCWILKTPLTLPYIHSPSPASPSNIASLKSKHFNKQFTYMQSSLLSHTSPASLHL